MSPSPQLAPPGSSTYSSNTMRVGDGTWDTQRNTFLLPNLMGLNFDTMRYNGMGNRFRELNQYHLLIRGHGVIAALTFLFIVPTAIMMARFFHRSGPWALRIHIWLQILTVALTTVVFVLGYFAVGPERSFTNPHHAIGLTLYVLVLTQAIGGWWVHDKEKGKRRTYLPLKVMLHQWFGRLIALLGLAQIPLGLTLYGSPVALFVLYALVAFALLIIYFILTYRQGRRVAQDYDSRDNYSSSSGSPEGPRRHGRLDGLVKTAAITVGLGALLRSRSRDRGHHRDRAEVVGSRRPSGSYIEDEKYSQYGRDRGREGEGLTGRLMKIGAIGGAVALAKKYFDRKKDRERETHERRYHPAHGRVDSISEDSLARLEEGRPLPSHQHPLIRPPIPPFNPPLNPPINAPVNPAFNVPPNPPLHHRRSRSSVSYGSYMSDEEPRVGGHRARDGIATLGAAGLLRNIFKSRRDKKEQRRVERMRRQELEEERVARMNSQGRYTGDGYPGRGGRAGSLTTSTNFTGSVVNPPRPNTGVPPPLPAGVMPVGVPGGIGPAPLPPGDPRSHTILGANNPVLTGAVNEPVNMPPIPPDPQGILHQDTSGSEAYISAGGRPHHRHRTGRDGLAAAAATGAAAGLAAAEANRRQSRNSTGEDSVTSPPVSVKVKMHRDGRHVTLRRLPEQEAAAEREARRRERQGKHHRRRSASSLGGSEGNERWRRTEALERQQAEEMRRQNQNQNELAAQQIAQGLVPPPPPIPSSSISPATGSVGSPGTEANSDYVNNRRRRRAERAGRQARQENKVEFE